jgi:hypothetical protein
MYSSLRFEETVCVVSDFLNGKGSFKGVDAPLERQKGRQDKGE